MHPQPPGAFVATPSFIVPGFPKLDDRYIPPFIALKLFFDALNEGHQALLIAEERRPEKRDGEDDHVRKLEQDSKAGGCGCGCGCGCSTSQGGGRAARKVARGVEKGRSSASSSGEE